MWKVKAILDKARADAAAVADDQARRHIWSRAWQSVGSILLPADPPRPSHAARLRHQHEKRQGGHCSSMP